MPEWLAWPVLVLTAVSLALLLPLALHRTQLLLLSRRVREEKEEWEGPLPAVTVQLPVYNEASVVERLLDAAARLDYPRELLQIQLLDDSTDETTQRAARRIEHWGRKGVRVEHLRRNGREGFKAGALALGLERAAGEFILVLDADFVPHPDLIHRLLGPFGDPAVGVVQARWDHLNEDQSILTRCQALLLDAHFFFEQGGRWAGGRFMNFNGTAGMWRRDALVDAGGWSSDTLTEDLDVSYRAQMRGWRFVFRPAVGVPSELPDTVRALEVQQKRWSQGGVQTGRKLLPGILGGPWRPAIKLEAVAHLMGHVAHPLTLLFGLLIVPSGLARQSLDLEGLLLLDLVVFTVATLSFLLFYSAAGRKRDRPWRTLVPKALVTVALGIGLTATVSRAVLRGLRGGGDDPFVRTPKRGNGEPRYRSPLLGSDLTLKVLMTGWMVASGGLALHHGLYMSIPFVLLFGLGYAWVTGAELMDRISPLGGRRAATPEEVASKRMGAVAS
jgi:cellulose synthase/poly-beta-1,6-N-acetylglucosamine synthase-like glycosyltransferase